MIRLMAALINQSEMRWARTQKSVFLLSRPTAIIVVIVVHELIKSEMIRL
jgi:hypothetical protein